MKYRFSLQQYLIIAIGNILSASACLHAENLIFNPGFELGDSGYTISKYLRPDTNPELKYEKSVIDTSTFDTGRQSLKIPNSFAEQGKLVIGEVMLDAGKEYTFSFAAKAEIDNCAVKAFLISAGPGEWNWDAKGKEFILGRSWKRYEFTVKTKDPWKEPHYSLHIEFGRTNATRPGALWFDSMQVAPATEKNYQTGADLEACSKFEKSVIIVPDGGIAAPVTAHVINNSSGKVNALLSMNLVEDRAGVLMETIDGETNELFRYTVELGPLEKKSITTNVVLRRYGAFRLDTVIKSGSKSAAYPDYCVTVAPIEKKLVDLDTAFCSGINFGGGGMLIPPHFGEVDRPGIRGMVRDLDEQIKMYADLGMRVFRDWDTGRPAFTWKDIEPEQGKFDFSIADRNVDQAARHGIRILPVLNGVFVVMKNEGARNIPIWIEPHCRTVEKSGEWKPTVKIPPIEMWRSYVRAVALHFKGRITHYEIFNEANGYLAASTYLEFLKSAHEEIKAADPAAKIVGFCSTGDMGGDMAGFLNTCYKSGGLAYADISSFHPYNAPHLGSRDPADKQIDLLKEQFTKVNAQPLPLWNTEIYYLTGKGDSRDKGFCRPEDAAFRFLTDLGEGVRQSQPLSAGSMFKRLHAQHFGPGQSYSYEYPSGVLAMYNTLTRFFEGAKPVKKIRWVPECICYVYEREGKQIAAFWRYGAAEGVAIQFGLDDKDADLFDMFGNRMSFKSMPLPMNGRPYYITWKGKDTDAFHKILASANVSAAVPIVFGTSHLTALPDGTWALAASFQNNLGTALPVYCGLQGGNATAERVAECLLPPGSNGTVQIPLRITKPDTASAAVLKVHVNGKLMEFPVSLTVPGKTCAAGREKEKPQQIDVTTRSKTPAHRAGFRAYRDDENLIISVKVDDTTPSGEPGSREPWEQDCIELFIDADPSFTSQQNSSVYHDRVVRMFVIPYATKDKQVVFMPKGLKDFATGKVSSVVELRDDGYVATVTIPFTSLGITPQPGGTVIGFDVAVDDAAGSDKAQAQLMWNSTGDAYKDRLSFGYIRIE